MSAPARLIVGALLIGVALASPSDSVASANERVRWAQALSLIHGVSPQVVHQLSPAQRRSLVALVEDDQVPSALRAKAVGLTGSAKACERALSAAEPEVIVRGAWCLVAQARPSRERTIAVAQRLLEAPQVEVREVGVRALSLVGDQAALSALTSDKDAWIADLSRRLLARTER